VNVGKKRLIDPVDPQAVGDGLVEGGDRGIIGVVSGLIAREVSPHMLDVETGLIAGIEPFDQLFERSFPGDDHELVASRHEALTSSRRTRTPLRGRRGGPRGFRT